MVDGPTLMNLVNIYSKESFLYDRGYYPYGSTTYDGSWSPIFLGRHRKIQILSRCQLV